MDGPYKINGGTAEGPLGQHSGGMPINRNDIEGPFDGPPQDHFAWRGKKFKVKDGGKNQTIQMTPDMLEAMESGAAGYGEFPPM